MIRTATAADLDAVLALNQANLPAVGALDETTLAHLFEISIHLAVADDDGAVVGALVGLDGPGREYASHNYAWFSERFDRFLYVDRVVVADSHHGLGVGRRLYDDFIAVAADEHTHLLAEVNVRPRNAGSLVFHDRLGFEALEEREAPSGAMRVVMLAKPIDAPSMSGSDDVTGNPFADEIAAPNELARLEADVATVERLLDRFHELEPDERSTMLDALDGGAATEPPAQA